MEFFFTHFWAIQLALWVLFVVLVLVRLSFILTLPWWVWAAPAIVALVLGFVYGVVFLIVAGTGDFG